MIGKFCMAALASCLLSAGSAIAFAAPQSFAAPKMIAASHHDVSPPLRDTRWRLPSVMQRIIQGRNPSRERLQVLRHKLVMAGVLLPPDALKNIPTFEKKPALMPARPVRDSVVQRALPAASSGGTVPITGFDGIGWSNKDNAPQYFPVNYWPPDANAAVGMKYVVETVNLFYAVYDKSDGSLVLGPMPIQNLWANFGNHCGAGFLQHPVVVFDQLAQRWIISVTTGNSPFAYCVAISETSDPTGEYYRYEFDNFSSAYQLAGYSKLGVWPDAYYTVFNMLTYGQKFDFVSFGALDRAAMLQGKETRLLLFNVPLSGGAYADLPATLDGFTPPPEGAPGLFANYTSPNLFGADSPYALALWKMHVDWSDPQSSRLTGPFEVKVPPFNDLLCGNDDSCIPQPFPGGLLNAVSDRLMYRLVYRNFGDHEALVANHTVTASASAAPPAAIRWAELDTSSPGAGDWSLAQSGTFDPADGASRWIGSIAMDGSGDMALGYSLASNSINPSIVYTGRLVGDPTGKMTQPETTLIAGGGPEQTGGGVNWGSYSSMALDPGDDCTFWYTNEYFDATAMARYWSTHIGAFKFTNCVPAPKGVVHGVVTDAASGRPVAGAKLALSPDDIVTDSDDDGNYMFKLPTGHYTATVSDFGYAPQTVSVNVTDGNTITQDFALQPAPSATLSGHVTDGSGHGYGLYAAIRISTPAVGQVAEVWTNPATGAYSVTLPKGFDYTLVEATYFDGYYPSAPVTITLDKDTVQDFAPTVIATCSAPGYDFAAGYGEDFNGRFPPEGWTVTNDVSGSPVLWNTNSFWDDENWTGGTGTAATVDSNVAASRYGYGDAYGTSIVSPPLAVTSLSADPVLKYKFNFDKYGYNNALDFDVRVDGGAWRTVSHFNRSYGGAHNLPGQSERVDLGRYITSDATNIQLRWHYYDTFTGDEMYAQLDDVVIGSCQPTPGGLIYGQVVDANTGGGIVGAVVSDDKGDQTKTIKNAFDPSLPAGSYLFFAPSGKRSLSVSAAKYTPAAGTANVADNAVIQRKFTLGAGQFSPAPAAITLRVPVNNHKTQRLTIDNTGTASARFKLVTINAPVAATAPASQGSSAAFESYKADKKNSIAFAAVPLHGHSRTEPLPLVHAVAAQTAGDVISSFPAGMVIGGLGVDRTAGDLWLGSPEFQLGGDNKDHRFLFDGTNTGDAFYFLNPENFYMADMAYDEVTGMFWQMSVDKPSPRNILIDYSHIYEFDPKTMMPTGRSIKVPSPQSERGLAYDPVSGTWYAGDFNSEAIYRFNASGKLLDSAYVGLPVLGLAYNPSTGHLFVLTSAGDHAVYVLDAKRGYAPVSSFDIEGYNPANAGPGLGYDCNGHLWISSAGDQTVFEVASGEAGWCAIKHIPWLSVAPTAGTLTEGASAAVTLDFDGAGQKASTTSQAQLKLAGNTPYGVQVIPVTVHWEAQPVDLVLTGEASPSPVNKGNNLVYMLTVANQKAKDHGSATETELSYRLPAGASYVSASGEGVSCTAPSGGSALAPAVTTGGTPGTVTCDLGTLAQGASKTVTIAVQANAAGTLASHFEVSAREPNDSDKNALDLTTTVIGTADVGVKASDVTLTEGDTGTLKMALANAGPDPATDVKLKVNAGGSVKLQGASASQGNCAPVSGSNGFNCDLGEIDSGSKATVSLTVFGISTGQASVQGRVTTSADDKDPGNNAATAQVTVKAAGNESGGNNGGGGALGWPWLAVLLGLAVAGFIMRRQSGGSGKRIVRLDKYGEAIVRGRKVILLAGILVLAMAASVGLTPASAFAQKTDLHVGLTSSGIALAHQARSVGPRVALAPQSSFRLLARAQKIGPHAADSTIELTLGLKLRHEARLKDFLQAVQNPASSRYRHFLTPAEFTAEYGPSKGQVAKVKKFLKRWGIEVTGVSADRLLIHTRGSTDAYEHALEVRINDYRLNGRRFYSTADRPRLPKTLAGVVANVIGLNHGVLMHSMSHFEPLPSNGSEGNESPIYSQGVITNAAPPATSQYFNPAQIEQAYDWPSIADTSHGAGVAIAILTADSANIPSDDYQAFWANFGLSDHQVTVVPVDGTGSATDGMGETLLDIELSGAMAPGADLEVYVIPNRNLSSFVDMYDQFTNDNNAQVMTTSWGAPEIAGIAVTTDAIFKKAAAQGISMFAAAGDHDASDGTNQNNMADYPAVSAYITAANGTELTVSDPQGDYGYEHAWSDTGGAVSTIIAQPDWQTGPGVPDTGFRMDSDLAMNAGPLHPYLVVFRQQWALVWGTSAVAPELAGLFAVGVSENGGVSLGQSNKLIYDDVNANSENYGTDFRDVTTGCNGKLADGTPSCAGKNWDHPTGFGSPKAKSLLSHLGVPPTLGTLIGKVTSATSGAPLAAVKVTTSPGVRHGFTNAQGKYSFNLPVGDYTATVSDFGYKMATAQVSIAKDVTTTQDFQLQAEPQATISGKVKDGGGHGYGLYAEIKVTSPGFGQVADVWTNPANGNYSVSLPEGFDYKFAVTAAFDGYESASWKIKSLDGDTSHDFVLSVSRACAAPGYSFIKGFGEDFNGGFPPAGWKVTSTSSVSWKATGGFFFGMPNYTGGSGNAALAQAHSTRVENKPYDTALETPPIAVTSLPANAVLSFLLNYQNQTKNDVLDVDMNAGGKGWMNVAHITKSHGAYYKTPGEAYSMNIGSLIPAGADSIQLRWRYHNPVGYKGYYAQVDDVSIGSCAIIPGGLIFGQVSDANTGDGVAGAVVTDDKGDRITTVANPADPNFPVGGYLYFAPAGQRTLTASDYGYADESANLDLDPNVIKTQNFALKTGRLEPDPAGISIDATVNGATRKILTISNIGTASAMYRLLEITAPPTASGSQPSAFVAQKWNFKDESRKDPAAFTARPGKPQTRRSVVFANSASTAPGSVISTFRSDMPIYGLGVDRDADDLWLGSPKTTGGDGADHRFLFDGANTGDVINVAFPDVGYMADMAYDDNTGTFWQLSVSADGMSSCIFELDPRSRQWTGKKICPDFPLAQRGLAYDPVSNTWYAGNFRTEAVYQFNMKGQIIGSTSINEPIIGLAFNPSTGHLFVLTSGGYRAVYVYDARNHFIDKPSSFDIPGFNSLNAGAGFGYDCDGDLWISDLTDQEIFEVASGEQNWCAIEHIPWLTVTPAAGTLAKGDSAKVALTVDGTGQTPYTSSRAQLKLTGNTPYGVQTIPVTVHWQAQPANLSLTGSAVPSSVNKGDNLVYTLTVANAAATSNGAATETTLTYQVPSGTSYVSGSGDGVSCSAPVGSPFAPMAATLQLPAGTVSCDLGTLAQGASKTVAIAVQANTAGTITSTFNVSAREPDSDASANSLTIKTEVIGAADVSASAADATITQGASGTMQVKVTNAGPDTAAGVKLKLSAGNAAKLQSATSDGQGSCSASGANALDCDLGDIASGKALTVDVKIFGTEAGTATVTTQATTSADDPNPDNNLAQATVTIKAGNGGGKKGGGGGGAFGGLALAALLALVLSGAALRRRRRSYSKQRSRGGTEV
jgi:uncharacterized repeat protein (TIGR01451 family)